MRLAATAALLLLGSSLVVFSSFVFPLQSILLQHLADNRNSTSDATAKLRTEKERICSLKPHKYLRSVVIPELMSPRQYDHINTNSSSVWTFPICQHENQTCSLATQNSEVLQEYFSSLQDTQKLMPFNDPYPTLSQQNNQTNHSNIAVRVLLDVPEWFHRDANQLPRWNELRQDCMGISCDARFGTFQVANETHVQVQFVQWPPLDPHTWKPHVFLKRMTMSSYSEIAKTMWNNHSIAFALQTGESCHGKGCQYGRGNLFASPGVIVNALAQGDVMSFAANKNALVKMVETTSPPDLSDFDGQEYYSGLFVTNCGGAPTRTRWLTALMDELPIASYGSCPRQTPGKKCPRFSSQCTKVKEAGKYPFHIAFENTPMMPGYITEKPWEALLSNTLPVLWSAPDLDAFFPPHSFIDVRQFTSPQALAGYLRTVRNDDALYNSYFDWRRDREQVDKFKRQLEVFAYGGPQQVCGICHAYLQKFVVPKHCGTSSVLPPVL